MNARLLALRLAAVLAFLLSPAQANVFRVTVTGTGTGTSWANACNLPYALTNAQAGDSLWLTEGQYVPVPTTGFTIGTRLSIYGGFLGTEASVEGRQGSFLKTLLDGDIGLDTNPQNNSDHVLSMSGIAGVNGAPGVLLDGLVIQNGYSHSTTVGAGIWSVQTDLDLKSCFVRHNYANAASQGQKGGGLYFTSYLNGSAPTNGYRLRIENCEFEDNTGWFGGGIYGDRARGLVQNTKFIDNRSFSNGTGGGVFLTRMGSANRLDFTNCIFWTNQALGTSSSGGGMFLGDEYAADVGGNQGGNVQLVNSTFASNTGSSGGDGQALVVSPNSAATVHNSIFFFNGSGGTGSPKPILGTATVNYSDVEGIWPGVGNLSVDPKFRDLNAGLLSLKATSPCLDAADYSQVPADDLDLDDDGDRQEPIPVDLLDVKRLIDLLNVQDSGNGSSSCSLCTYLDMGAYERP